MLIHIVFLLLIKSFIKIKNPEFIRVFKNDMYNLNICTGCEIQYYQYSACSIIVEKSASCTFPGF